MNLKRLVLKQLTTHWRTLPSWKNEFKEGMRGELSNTYVNKISKAPKSFDFFNASFWTWMLSLSVRKTSSFVGDKSYCFIAIE